MLGYNRFGNMTDIPYGTLINFPIPGPYAQPSPQYVTATENLGDMDQWGLTWEHRIGDTFTYFAGGGYIKSHPNGKVSQYGFGGLLGDPNKSQSGTAYYARPALESHPQGGPRARVQPRLLPLVHLHARATGELGDKLAARGNVWEGYLRYTFSKHTSMRVGYTYYDYSTAFSGWHIAPANLDYYNLDNNAVNFYAFPKTVKNAYFLFDAKW